LESHLRSLTDGIAAGLTAKCLRDVGSGLCRADWDGGLVDAIIFAIHGRSLDGKLFPLTDGLTPTKSHCDAGT